STSSETSRLAARKARKRSAKSGARVSRRIGMLRSMARRRSRVKARCLRAVGNLRQVRHMARARGRGPDRTEIGELGLQAFDLEAQRGATREHQRDDAGRRIVLDEFDGQEVEDGAAVRRVD